MSHRQTIYFNEKHFTYYSSDGGKRSTYHVHGNYPLGSKLLMTVVEQDASTTSMYHDLNFLKNILRQIINVDV